MTWLKLTKSALYLMQGNAECYIKKVDVTGQPLHLNIPLDWFVGRDVPGVMVIDLEGENPDVYQIRNGRTLQRKKVVLDPGHGEDGDPGALGQGRRVEQEEVLKQAKKIKQLLEMKGAFVEIVPNELNLSLLEIGARGAGADCFVSLHLNAFNSSAQGHEVLVETNGTSLDEKFAGAINTALDQEFAEHSMLNRGVKRQSLCVLRAVPLPVPAVLVESFFIDATPERLLDEYTERAAGAIAQGIEAFLTA